jgi:hypothetical protein
VIPHLEFAASYLPGCSKKRISGFPKGSRFPPAPIIPAAGKRNAGGRSQRRAGIKGTVNEDLYRTRKVATQ